MTSQEEGGKPLQPRSGQPERYQATEMRGCLGQWGTSSVWSGSCQSPEVTVAFRVLAGHDAQLGWAHIQPFMTSLLTSLY